MLASTRLYISEMVKIAGPQMKVMLLDKETVRGTFISFSLQTTKDPQTN